MCPWQRMDGQGPSGQCSPGQEWWIQLHQWIAVINRMVWRWSVTATRQPRAPGVASTERTGSGMQVNQAWPSQYYIWRCKVYALQSRWSALLSSGARRKEEKKKKCWFSDVDKDWVTDLFAAHGGYWAVVLRTSTGRLDKSWLYIVFSGRSQMKCAASLSAPVHRHEEALKRRPWSRPFWICYGSVLPWTVTTLTPPLTMVSYDALRSLGQHWPLPPVLLWYNYYNI